VVAGMATGVAAPSRAARWRTHCGGPGSPAPGRRETRTDGTGP